MRCLVILTKIKPSLILTSILWGALFFCPYFLTAQDDVTGIDSVYIQDTISFRTDTILQNKNLSPDTLSNVSEDTTVVLNDTLIVLKDGPLSHKKKVREHSPPRATILSAVLPGLGQAYNGKYWKIPIIYVAGGALYSYFDFANQKYNKFKELYATEYAKDDEADQYLLSNYSSNIDRFSKYRGYAVIFMGILYVANVVDAMVDAHFYVFDISDDLSLRIEPKLEPAPNYYAFDNFTYGFKLSVNF